MKKQTGVIRRIDELGRIVIPKGLRDQLKITEGQPFEIFLTEKGFMLDVYRPEPNKAEIAREWLNHNQALINRYGPQFFISGECTCCVAVTPEKKFPLSFGKARCAASDEYNYNVGKIISFCRAIDRPELIPEEFFE